MLVYPWHGSYLFFTGVSGGPGTVFFLQTGSPGIGKVIVDNFAKNPNIFKPSSTSAEFDVLTQGKEIAFECWFNYHSKC